MILSERKEETISFYLSETKNRLRYGTLSRLESLWHPGRAQGVHRDILVELPFYRATTLQASLPCLPLSCRDLLGKAPQEKLDIKLCPDGSGQLYVPGMTEFPVHCLEDINKVRQEAVFTIHGKERPAMWALAWGPAD